MIIFFIKGLVIGLAIAAPVGPIGILCIQRSLHDGFKVGMMTGMGAALADGTYGLIAGFGLTTLSSFLAHHHLWIRFIGGLFLIYVGIRLIFARPEDRLAGRSESSALHACITSFLLTLANPATILAFIALFAGLGIGIASTNYREVAIFVLGITLGSALWWILLSGGVAFILHRKLGSSVLREINWISGSVILVFGVIALFFI